MLNITIILEDGGMEGMYTKKEKRMKSQSDSENERHSDAGSKVAGSLQ